MDQAEIYNNSDFSLRLKAARQSLGLTQEDLGKRWDLSHNYLYMMEAGRKAIPRKYHAKIAELEAEVRKKFDIGEETRASGLAPADTAPPWFAARFEPGLKLRPVPVVSWAGCGAIGERGLNFSDAANQLDEQVWTDCRDANAFALIMEGHSMESEILPGDRVVFAPNEIPRNGDVVVARLREGGGVLVKRFRALGPEGKRVRLESTHPDYPAKEYDVEEFRFIYPAVDLKRRMRR